MTTIKGLQGCVFSVCGRRIDLPALKGEMK